MTDDLTWRQAAAWRIARHQLHERAPASEALAVASRLTGLHAQLMSSAELTLWARIEDLAPDTVQRALWEDRTLVKMWAVRGTLHLLPVEELPLWLGVLGTYRHYLKDGWARGFGMTPGERDRLIPAIADALDGRMLTREELASEVGRVTGSDELAEHVRHSWGSLLKPATYQGHLCFAPSDGRHVRFTSPRNWVGPVEPLDGDAALEEIARRYLSAHGPATREDFARWLGVSPAAGGSLLTRVGEPIGIEGSAAWILPEHAADLRGAGPGSTVRLIPAFDQFVVTATVHATRLMRGDRRAWVYRPQGWLSPIVLVGSEMAGVWRHERKGRRLRVSVEPFVKLPARVWSGVEEEAERLAAFLGGELELVRPA